jgi:hypothetical protein
VETIGARRSGRGAGAGPRTVNSLGPDERDARWVSGVGTQWKWDNGRWWHTEPYGVAGIWIAAPYGYTPNASGPYTEATAQPLTFRGWAVPAILEVLAEAGDVPALCALTISGAKISPR